MTRLSKPNAGAMTAAEVQAPVLEAEAERELRKLASDDPDVFTLTEYMLGALPPAQARLFECRLQSDERLASWAIPVLRARDLIAEERQRALDGAPAGASLQWEQVQRRMPLESLDARRAAVATGGGEWGQGRGDDGRAPRTAGRIVTRLVLWAMAVVVAVILGAFTIPYLGQLAAGVASAVTGGWEVTRGYGLGGAQLRLPNGGVVSGIGPTYIALRKDGWLDPSGWGARRFDVYAHAPRLSVATGTAPGEETRLDSPRAIVISQQAFYTLLDDEGRCATRIEVSRGRIIVASTMAPERTLPLAEGETATIACDGTLSRGALPPGGVR